MKFKQVLLFKKLIMYSFYGIVAQLICCTFLLAAEGTKAQSSLSVKDIKVNVKFENDDLKSVFKKIEEQTDLIFVFNNDDISKKTVRINKDYFEESMYDVLLDISKTSDLSFKQVNKNINVRLTSENQAETGGQRLVEIAEDVSITGKVTDENGEGLPGASIIEKGTTNGTTTDLQGNYKLVVLDNSVITISFVGYETRELAVAGRSTIDVQMKLDAAQLQEVVVVGYGEVNKRDITTSISSMDSESLSSKPLSGFDQAMAGAMPGVQVALTSGAPGADAEIRIRGIGTLTAGSQPLIVLDGVPLPEGTGYSTINPSNIESVDVLKDASATSIYGSRGANGVIIITSKKGKYSQRPTINFDFYSGIQKISKKIDLMDAYEMASYVAASRNNAWENLNPANSADDPNSVRSDRYKIPEYMQPYLDGTPGLTNTDWQDEIFRTAPIQNFQLSVDGGSERSRYFVSGDYFNQTGIIENTDFERYSLRAGLETQLSERLNFGLNILPSFSNSNLTNPGGHWQNGVVIGTFFAQPFFPVYNPDGSLQLTEMLGAVIDDKQFKRAVQNPVAIAKMEKRTKEEVRFIGNGFLDFKIMEGLVFKTNWGLTYTDRTENFFRPSALGFYNNLPPAVSEGSLKDFQSINWLSENTLNFKRNIDNTHNVSILAGYTFQQERLNWSQIAANDFQNDKVQTLNSGTILVNDTYSRESAWSLISYLGRISYDYKGKYLMTASIRSDGSSRFGDDSKWGVFPSFSAGWRVNRENFMSGIEAINEFKARVSWGVTGNNQIGDFASKSLLTTTNYVLGNTLTSGLSPSTLPNELLSWETKKMLDLGLDVEMLDGKLFFTLDYFESTTDDLLLNVPIPASAGYTSSITNIGKVRNNGWEFLVGTGINLGPVKWQSSFNVSTVRNEVLALGPDQDQIISGGVFMTKVGHPISSFYGYKVNGVYTDQAELDNLPGYPGAQLGTYIYEDFDGNGEINVDDRHIIGDPWPNYSFGFNNSFQFKGLDFSFTIQGVNGYDVYLNNAFTYYLHEAWTNMHRDMLQAVNDPANSEFAWPNIDNTDKLWGSSTKKFADASYARLRSLSLGYTFPESVVSSLGISRLRGYITGQNLATITSYPGYNPEVDDDNGGGILETGRAYSEYPIPKSLILGFNITF